MKQLTVLANTVRTQVKEVITTDNTGTSGQNTGNRTQVKEVKTKRVQANPVRTQVKEIKTTENTGKSS